MDHSKNVQNQEFSFGLSLIIQSSTEISETGIVEEKYFLTIFLWWFVI